MLLDTVTSKMPLGELENFNAGEFTVEDYSWRNDRLSLVLFHAGREYYLDCDISRADLENYFDKEGILSYQMNYSDHTGEPVEYSGKITIDEYFENCPVPAIYSDLEALKKHLFSCKTM